MAVKEVDRVAHTRAVWQKTGNVRDLVAYVDQWAWSKGWRSKSATIGDRLMLMVTEIAEAMEEHRKGKRPDESYYLLTSHGESSEVPAGTVGAKPEGIPAEMADTVIRIADFCALHGIDLQAAIETKMLFNEGRPFRHGKTI